MVPQDPDLVWSKSRVYSQQTLNMLHLFVKHCGKSPEELLNLQSEARKSDDPDAEYVVLNMVKGWISTIKGRKQTKLNYISTVRSFFEYHHRPLPPDKNWIRGLRSDRGKVEGHVSPDVFQTIIHACRGDPRKLSMLLVQLQSFSGPRELCIIGNTMGPHIAEGLKKGPNLVGLYFDQGRKHSDKPWHTYIGKDSCDALREWFKIRGYPTQADPIIWPSENSDPNKKGDPLTTSAVRQIFARITARLGYRPKLRTSNSVKKKPGEHLPTHVRYGVSIKELRDLSLSLSQQAVGKENESGERFQESSAEYFSGHTIDELGYRKIHDLDPEYRKRQYLIVEPYLSPVSCPNGTNTRQIELEEKNKALEAKLKEQEARLERLEAISVERLVLAAGTKKQPSQKKRKRSTRN